MLSMYMVAMSTKQMVGLKHKTLSLKDKVIGKTKFPISYNLLNLTSTNQ